MKVTKQEFKECLRNAYGRLMLEEEEKKNKKSVDNGK